MASKRPPPLDHPPSASSEEDYETDDENEQEIIVPKTIQQPSDSEDEEGSESESESEEEEDETPPVKNPQIPNPNSKSSSQDEEEDSDSEEETQKQTTKSSSICEFESDIQSPSVSNFEIKPSKTLEKKQVLKRPSLASEMKSKKKSKLSNGDVNDDEKKSSGIKRVWSEEEELMLLQKFIDFQSKNGSSSVSDMDIFYQLDCLPENVSKTQLYEKVRRLKNKFRANEEKVSANGEDSVLVKPHERKLFEISKTIWGVNGCAIAGNANGSNAKSKARSVKPKPKPKAEAKVEKAKVEEAKVEKAKVKEAVEDEMLVKMNDFETLYPFWNAGMNLGDSSSLSFPMGIVGLFREELSLIDEAKVTEMNEKWKDFFEKEAVLQKRKTALLSRVGNLEA